MNYYLHIRMVSTPDRCDYRFWTNAMDALGIPKNGVITYPKEGEREETELDFIAEYRYDSFGFIDKLNEHNLSLIQEIRETYDRIYYFK